MSFAAAHDRPSPPPSRPRAPADAPGEFAWRVLTLLNSFRLVLGIVLLLTYLLVTEPRIVGENEAELARAAILALVAFAAAELFLLRTRRGAAALHVYLQFIVDLAAVTALLLASGGISSGLGGLLIVSAGTLALLVPADRAFLLAALAAIALLAQQTLLQLQGAGASAEYAPAGILGAVIFLITAVVQLLRHRLVETEALAEQRGVDLRNLVELNEYIIQHLRESIVVVDGEDRVRLMNESAGKLLRSAPAARGGELRNVSPELAARLERWRGGTDSEMETALIIAAEDGGPSIHPHFAPLGRTRGEGVVIFLEDTSLIAERVQQTKLAALGRLSASIAHEIRNPLGALSHAGQLLAESASIGSDERRLTDIIRVNSRRVSQIVDSVLSLSKRDKTLPERLRLRDWARDFASEFTQTQELYEGAVAVRPDAEDVEVEMDRTHLHQVAWNLCENAVKYASKTAGAIAVELGCGRAEASGRPYLEVADRGPGIPPDKAEQIFEPFYTGQPGGTGLGLYISRELCERNGATLRYQTRPEGGSLFRIVFADPKRWRGAE